MVLVGVAGVARAADEQPERQPATEALRHLDQGNRLYRDGRYAEAVREYRETFALVPSGKLHFNIAVAEKMRGNLVVAAQELDLFREDPGDADDNVRAHADGYLTELAAVIVTVDLQLTSSPPGSIVFVDDVRLAMSRVGRPIRLAPGNHRFVVRTPSAGDWSQAVDLAPGTQISLAPQLDLNPAPPPDMAGLWASPAAPPPNNGGPRAPLFRRWWFWAGVASVAGAGLTAALLVHGRGSDPCEGKLHCFPLMPEPKP